MPTPGMEPHRESLFPRERGAAPAKLAARASDEAEPHGLAPAAASVTMTSQPTNESELQLYRVLQHANLLSYYDTFISQGGDDVQQLCEAGEEEFLEIMALVGMASKPLHVRRLQKALQEWISSPGRFQVPIVPLPAVSLLPTRAPAVQPGPASTPAPARPTPSPPSPSAPPPAVASPSPSLGRERDQPPSPSPSQDSRDQTLWQLQRAADAGGADSYPSSGSPQLPTPVLLESQVQRLAESAARVAKTLPSFEPRAPNSKKKICRELEQVMSMPKDDPKRLEKFREFAAIYGRFDCKRKAEKPLTLHEVSVNEAAAHICMQVPALLTRRDELFPLARQVVRHSGYQYSKGHSRSQGAQGFSPRDFPTADDGGGGKRPRLDSDSLSDEPRDGDWRRRQERLEQIADELHQLQERGEELRGATQRVERGRDAEALSALRLQMDSVQDKERRLVLEQTDLISQNKHLYKSSMDFDDDDSQFSLNSIPSPVDDGADSPREADLGNGFRDRPAGKQVMTSSSSALTSEGYPTLTTTAVALSLVTHTKTERVKSELVTSPSRGNGCSRQPD